MYRVDDTFWQSVLPQNDPEPTDAELSQSFDHFIELVLAGPTGSFSRLDRGSNTVTLRNTARTLDRMERDLGAMDGSGVFYKEGVQ